MLGGQIRIWHLVKVRVCIVGVSRDETVFRPADNSRFMDVEASSRLRCRQHAAVAKSVVARAKCVSMDEIDDAPGSETSAAAPRSGRSAGTKSLLIENVGDFGVDVIVLEFVHEFDDGRRRLDLLRR